MQAKQTNVNLALYCIQIKYETKTIEIEVKKNFIISSMWFTKKLYIGLNI